MKPRWFLIATGWAAGFALLSAAVRGVPGEQASTGGRLAERRFGFTYEVEVAPAGAGAGPIDIFVPLAQSDLGQEILRREVVSTIPGQEGVEREHGNRFWHGHLDRSDGNPVCVEVEYEVRRTPLHPARGGPPASPNPSGEDLALLLRPDRLVPVSGSLIDRLRRELPASDGTRLGRARAIYDFVIDNMEYKKVGTGWGNGDTYWACSMRYGNCTDFHALFISLARAEGIPARFEIGFPIPEDSPSGEVSGYHCWVKFYLPDVGWFPIDASEAARHPERRDLFFGTHPADRIQFTVGRDLVLGEGHTTGPLNYFIYPHVEVQGSRFEDLRTRFRYGRIGEGDLSAAARRGPSGG